MKRAALLIALSLAGPVHAEFYSGNSLARLLAIDTQITLRGGTGTREEAFDAGLGVGFIVGVADVYTRNTICPPQAVTVGQMVEIVKLYFRAIPHRLHEFAEPLVEEALRKAFPCQQRQQSAPGTQRSL
jgi:hypothetical protein